MSILRPLLASAPRGRAALAMLVDLVIAGVTFQLSMSLRLGDQLLVRWDWPRLVQVDGLFVAVCAVVFWSQGLHRDIWRYVSTGELVTIARAVGIASLLYLPALFLINRLDRFPRSTLIIEWFVLSAALGGVRLAVRMVTERRFDLDFIKGGFVRNQARRIPVLVAGEGEAAAQFIRACAMGGVDYRPVGLLSTRKDSVGGTIHGVPVLGRLSELERVADLLKGRGLSPQRLVIGDPNLAGPDLRLLFDRADALGIGLARLPRVTELSSAQAPTVAPIAVEDLLGRPQAVLDRDSMRRLVQGRRVLVTGAGGSIGSELTRQLAAFDPAFLSLVDASEFALYTIDMEMSERHATLPRRAVLSDVRDRAAMEALFAEQRPELVFHAAALKHVPLVEANPLSGLLTNVVGTRILAEIAARHGVALMVQISTDKAVNPTNVMGASKRAAEIWCQAADLANAPGGTHYVTVRFGNVLGSTGSVVPLFQRQLAGGGPLTVTDERMTRFFMTVREAVELVLQASVLGHETEEWRGRIFVLDMGAPVRIVDLARQMIRLAGLRPDQDIRIAFTGLRPGEKLYEELFHEAEPPLPTGREGILVAAVRAHNPDSLADPFDRLETACRTLDHDAALAVLRGLVPELDSGNTPHPSPPPQGGREKTTSPFPP